MSLNEEKDSYSISCSYKSIKSRNGYLFKENFFTSFCKLQAIGSTRVPSLNTFSILFLQYFSLPKAKDFSVVVRVIFFNSLSNAPSTQYKSRIFLGRNLE